MVSVVVASGVVVLMVVVEDVVGDGVVVSTAVVVDVVSETGRKHKIQVFIQGQNASLTFIHV